MQTIPSKFKPSKNCSKEDKGDLRHCTEDGFELQNLFEDDDSNNDETMITARGNAMEDVTIGDRTYRLIVPDDVGTLFAHQVWSGSKLLAGYLVSNPEIISKKYVIEFGAATAVPSLVSLHLQSALTIITDYPDESILTSIRETVGINWVSQNENRVDVVGYEWGSCSKEIKNLVNKIYQQGKKEEDTADNSSFTFFDVAIASECLWNHKLHKSLAKSIHEMIHPTKGICILTYAHHIPGKEEEDDAFFTYCRDKYGLHVEHVKTESMPYMWDARKSIDVYLKVLKRTP